MTSTTSSSIWNSPSSVPSLVVAVVAIAVGVYILYRSSSSSASLSHVITTVPRVFVPRGSGIKKFKKNHEYILRYVPYPNFLSPSSNDLSQLGKSISATISWREFFADLERTTEFRSKGSQNTDRVKVLFLCRHAEGEHNAAERRLGSEIWEGVEAKSWKYFDAPINEAGKDQCYVLKTAVDIALRDGLEIDMVIVSPLTRAIQTAKIGFESIWGGKVPIVSYEVARERFGKNTCDKRKSLSVLKQEYPEITFFLDGEDDPYWTEVRETPEQVKRRAQEMLNLIMNDDDHHSFLLCGHSDYISNMITLVGHPFHWPANCEVVPLVIHGEQIKKTT